MSSCRRSNLFHKHTCTHTAEGFHTLHLFTLLKGFFHTSPHSPSFHPIITQHSSLSHSVWCLKCSAVGEREAVMRELRCGRVNSSTCAHMKPFCSIIRFNEEPFPFLWYRPWPNASTSNICHPLTLNSVCVCVREIYFTLGIMVAQASGGCTITKRSTKVIVAEVCVSQHKFNMINEKWLITNDISLISQ